jgi:hypothetical protein
MFTYRMNVQVDVFSAVVSLLVGRLCVGGVVLIFSHVMYTLCLQPIVLWGYVRLDSVRQ